MNNFEHQDNAPNSSHTPVSVRQAYQPPKKSFFQQLRTNRKMQVLIGSVFAIIAIVVLALAVIANSGTKVQLNEHYEIKIAGLNEYATASVRRIKNAANEPDLAVFTTEQRNFVAEITFNLSKSKSLKNGDTVQATAVFNKKAAKELDLNLKNTTLKLKVENLEKGKAVDVFKGLEVSYDGVSPVATVSLSNNNPDPFVRTVTYDAQPSENLKNGDKITVSARYSDEKAVEEKVVVQNETKTFTVKGLPEYIDESTKLSPAQKETIHKECSDIITAKIASYDDFFSSYAKDYISFPKTVSSTEPVLHSQTILSLKSPAPNQEYNILVNIYSMSATVTHGMLTKETANLSGYTAVIHKGVYIDQDGNAVLPEYSGQRFSSDIDWENHHNVEELVKKHITAQKDAYIATEIK